MNASAARLIVFGAPGSWRRLVAVAAGFALGTGMVLVLLGTYLHMPERDDRIAWHAATGEWREYEADEPYDLVAIPETDDGVLVASTYDFFDGKPIETTLVASSPETSVTFPAGLTPPTPDEYYASPALADLIAKTPANQLGDRYGTLIGELPASMLKGPDQLIALRGVTWDDANANPNARLQFDFPTTSSRGDSLVFRIIIAIGSVALLVPVVLLIGIVSELGAAARRERLATVRLIGAGRRAMASLAALEMGAASLVGAVAGVGVAEALRPAGALLPINGTQSYLADLRAPWGWVIATMLGMAALAAVTAWWRAWRDEHGALGATRERAEKRPTWRRVIPLMAAMGVFAGSTFGAVRSDSANPMLLLLGIVGGFAGVAFGIVVAGSWLTRLASLAFARVARRASSVVAAGRLARHPRSTFRSVAGVVVAVFVVSVLAGVIGSVSGQIVAADRPGVLPLGAVVAQASGAAQARTAADAASTLGGVQRVVVPVAVLEDGMAVVTQAEATALGVADVPDATWVAVDIDRMLTSDLLGLEPRAPYALSETQAGAAGASAGDHATASVIAVTDGSRAGIESARTAMALALDPSNPPMTRTDLAGGQSLRMSQQLTQLAYVGMAIAIGISAIALTVSTVSAALDRRRTFGLLRLGGMPVGSLRATIAIEAALPLAVTLVASAGLGLGVAYVLIQAIGNGLYFTWPNPSYWWTLAASVSIAAIAVAASFGTVRRSTELASTRFE